ncbi:Primosome PriB/single-strand DNA-binding [Dillenia turbinata]|uniref:Primosome PriB/single-strand DNA-binding n=1 Tax=Dillenia turbinata TaxID=194707 RepID=A0AAN8UY94_9MAGN
MASSLSSAISRRLSLSFSLRPTTSLSHSLLSFCTKAQCESPSEPDLSDSDPIADNSSSTSPSLTQSNRFRPLENGMDIGIYRAILVGQVGQTPVEKKLKNGMTMTMFTLGTGGIRNNRRPFENEDPKDYANRSAIQWHRVTVYPGNLGNLMKSLAPGSILYIEGNLETKIFTEPVSGLVRRIREIAVRKNGRIVFLGDGTDAQQSLQKDLKGVGYF